VLAGSSPTRHILTINAEEYFHGGALAGAVARKHWDRLESRLDRSIGEVLGLLERHSITATFFVMGWSAERNPDVVRRIIDGGHEVASRGYWPRGVSGMMPQEFREDLRRTQEVLNAAGAPQALGFRSPRWIRRKDLWILDVLAEEGYRYDASVNPLLRRFADDPRFKEVHERRHSLSNMTIWEVPVSTGSFLGWRYGISGGNYLRQFPAWLMRRQIQAWQRRSSSPLVFYLTPWELDGEQPQIANVSRLNRIRQYRNLKGAREVFEDYFARLRFCSVADYLELDRQPAAAPRPVAPERIEVRSASAAAGSATHSETAGAAPVSLVIPLYNEEETVVYLRRTLESLRKQSLGRFDWQVVLVDDASRDNTLRELERHFADWPEALILRQDQNRGVAAAILKGLRSAKNEIVCSIDCDCSYDPAELLQMIPKLDGKDMVTASPYHPDGSVFRVPAWRLFLSHNLSRMYSVLLGDRLYTYTSCVRVYKKSAVAPIEVDNGGFLGVAELLVRLRLAGGRIVEHPAQLESRLLGVSKMKTVRTIRAHLGLLTRLALRRETLRKPGAAPPQSLPQIGRLS
jgi:polysaccharide deacetylase family protein (PEP-CTERM system associated)